MPPKWIFKLVTALHPETRRRIKRAKEYTEKRLWREDVRRWDEEVKPTLFARFRKIEAVDPASLTDVELAAHLHEAGEATVENFREHFMTNPATVYPVGDFLVHAAEWTGVAPQALLDLVRGEGTGANAPGDDALEALATSLRKVDNAPKLLNGGQTPAQALHALRGRQDEIGAAARAWLGHVENRMVSTGDFSTPTGAECPELLVAHVQHALKTGKKAPPAPAVRLEDVRQRVPEDRRAEFDDLLAEAKLTYRLRDERSTQLDCWCMGLVRRALLEAGRRLAAKGLLEEAEHVLELSPEELAGLLRGDGGPTGVECARRATERLSIRMEEAPLFLNIDGEPPQPPLDYFPPHVARMFRAVFCYVDHMDRDAPEPEKPVADVLSGLAASKGQYTGPARIVVKAEDFAKVQPGDVLVARATMPAYNVLLPIVKAIVTDKGGVLCHAAIVSREYGIPAVVGTREATLKLKDGDIVTVDGDAGVVRMGERAEPQT